MKTYFRNLSILVIIVSLVMFGILYLWAQNFGILIAAISVLSSASIAFISSLFLYQAIQSESNYAFLSKITTSMLLKFVLSIAATLICVWLYKPFKVHFAVSFFITYFIFTGYEVWYMMKLNQEVHTQKKQG